MNSFEDLSFNDLLAFWFQANKKNFSPGHIRRTDSTLNKILPKIGKKSALSLHPQRLNKIQQELLEDGIKPKSVNREMKLIIGILNYATKMRKIPRNPSLGFQHLKESVTEMSFWEKDEAFSFLEYTSKLYPKNSPTRWIYLAYLLALNTGLRSGEIWGLQAGDLSRDGELLNVRRQWDRVLKNVRFPKSSKTRRVPCNQELRTELKEWFSHKKLRDSDFVFQNSIGKPICHDNFVKRNFRTDIKNSEVRPIRFHDLRHTAGTLMIEAGINVVTVQEILGHSDIKTTMRYVHVLGSSLRQASKQFSLSPKTT